MMFTLVLIERPLSLPMHPIRPVYIEADRVLLFILHPKLNGAAGLTTGASMRIIPMGQSAKATYGASQ